MFADLMGDYGSRLVVAVVGVALALICLVGILWIVRGRRGPSPFVRGGRNRQPRLQVLDAAAVDARRRLVLVRRDDVEHLIMIGGPTDIVIESRILPIAPTVAEQAAPAPAQAAAQISRPAPAEAPRQVAQRPVARPEPAREIAAAETRVSAAPLPVPANPAPAAIPAARAEPIAADIRTPPRAQAMAPIQETASPQPLLDDAARLLDSQRDRVFADRSAQPAAPFPPPVRQIPVQTSSVNIPGSAATTTSLGSDFDKILEQEMANNMAGRDASLAAAANRGQPPSSPVAAIAAPGAAKSEPTLQSEVARIFGEMSATRDK
jgi:hypothetical protein